VANGEDGAPRVARTTASAEPAKPETAKLETAKPETAKPKPRRGGGEGQGNLFG
jgi:hypothetical protein